MSRFGQFVKHELHELIPVTLFFFVTFELLALKEALMVKRYAINVSSWMR